MLLDPVSPPQPVATRRGFDSVAVDGPRRRAYAAHPSSDALVVVDTASGKVVRSIRVGGVQGVAVDPETGHVFTGDGADRRVSEIDPVAGVVVRSVALDGEIDDVAYDPGLRRVYADEDDGSRVFVVDARAMRRIATIDLPGHHPESLVVEPRSHIIYQNVADLGEIAAIDPTTLRVRRVFAATGVRDNHPLGYDAGLDRLVVGGGKALALLDRSGRTVATLPTATRYDQCALDGVGHRFVCAGEGRLDVYRLGARRIAYLGGRFVGARAHTVGYDAAARTAWTVWSEPGGEYAQGFRLGGE